jgi:hypothetical protein
MILLKKLFSSAKIVEFFLYTKSLVHQRRMNIHLFSFKLVQCSNFTSIDWTDSLSHRYWNACTTEADVPTRFHSYRRSLFETNDTLRRSREQVIWWLFAKQIITVAKEITGMLSH